MLTATRTPQRTTLLVSMLFIGLGLCPQPAGAAQAPAAGPRHQALACEKRGEWLEACRLYDEALRRDRSRDDCRQGYQRCLRRYHLARRHRDPSYRLAIGRLSPSQALDAYERVLATVSAAYVDRHRAGLGTLFRNGLVELRFALQEPAFLREYLPHAPAAALDVFKHRLARWPIRRLASRAEAREQVLAVARAAQEAGLPARPLLVSAIGLEFAAGACNALDEYTLLLTPGQLSDAQTALRGKYVGVGIDLNVVERNLEVARVYPRSPAQEAGLQKHDRILRIGRERVGRLPPELAAERLRGGPGTAVELEVLSPGQPAPRTVRLVRRPVIVPSVEHVLSAVLSPETNEEVAVGYLRISYFQETTVQEVKEAIAILRTEGMRALVLDLRGNPGGLFKPAVQVAELFLSEGVIVFTQSQFKEYNRPYRVENLAPLMIPLVVMIDGETASAAEVLAGALRDLRPRSLTVLVGQTTFGKGSIQCVIPLDRPPLDRTPGGIRITVARFFSPTNQPYTGQGVLPTSFSTLEDEAALDEARRLAVGLLLGRPVPMMPPSQ